MEPVADINVDSEKIWCTLVMNVNSEDDHNADHYAKGAITLCQSARDVGTVHPFYCMVAGNISADTIAKLEAIFDKVINVPLISRKCVPMKSKKQVEIYGGWIQHCFTKCNILNPDLFPDITDVVLVDADCMFKQNIDADIFDKYAPAMTFSSPWAYPYMGTREKPTGGKNTFYDYKRGIELKHNQMVQHNNIMKGFNGGILGLACMVHVRPNYKSFDNMQKLLNKNVVYGDNRCVAGFDEQLFAETFLADGAPIYHIHQQYNHVVGKTKWLLNNEKPKTMQWYNGKPWYSIDGPDDIKKSEWPDVIEWWECAQKVIDNHPEWESWFYTNNPKYSSKK